MNDPEKSDPRIVATKPTNKAGRPGAELVEPRLGTKGNAGQQSTHRSQNRARVTQALDRVRHAARQRKKEQFTALLHHVNVDALRIAFYALKRKAAPGMASTTVSIAAVAFSKGCRARARMLQMAPSLIVSENSSSINNDSRSM